MARRHSTHSKDRSEPPDEYYSTVETSLEASTLENQWIVVEDDDAIDDLDNPVTATVDDIERFGITRIYSHPKASTDIVSIHGINGHPRDTMSDNCAFWPSQLLQTTLKGAEVRMLVYGYKANVGTEASSDMIHHHAQRRLTTLSSDRYLEDKEESPTIWVVDSVSGILVKRVSLSTPTGWRQLTSTGITVCSKSLPHNNRTRNQRSLHSKPQHHVPRRSPRS